LPCQLSLSYSTTKIYKRKKPQHTTGTFNFLRREDYSGQRQSSDFNPLTGGESERQNAPTGEPGTSHAALLARDPDSRFSGAPFVPRLAGNR
jgi:hypothetical protein